ncbi:transposase [Deltaproteobacteria bacterium TL4]
MVSVVTTNDLKDSQVLEDLIDPIQESIDQVSADGAYDSLKIHEYLKQKGLHAVIPPQKNAVVQFPDTEDSPLLRDHHLQEIEQLGRDGWKLVHHYHRRSLAETAMFRYKQIFDDRLKNRDFDHQATEAFIRCAALNKMTQLGMPLSCQVL